LNKQELTAMQLSKCKVVLKCEMKNYQVEIAGITVTYLIGEGKIPNRDI
jgi:hypothetical protein